MAFPARLSYPHLPWEKGHLLSALLCPMVPTHGCGIVQMGLIFLTSQASPSFLTLESVSRIFVSVSLALSTAPIFRHLNARAVGKGAAQNLGMIFFHLDNSVLCRNVFKRLIVTSSWTLEEKRP